MFKDRIDDEGEGVGRDRSEARQRAESGHEDIKNVETIVSLSCGNVPPPRGERRLLGDDFHRDDSGKKEAC